MDIERGESDSTVASTVTSQKNTLLDILSDSVLSSDRASHENATLDISSTENPPQTNTEADLTISLYVVGFLLAIIVVFVAVNVYVMTIERRKEEEQKRSKQCHVDSKRSKQGHVDSRSDIKYSHTQQHVP